MMEKINYQLILDKTLEHIKKSNLRPKLLLHACCAPCSSYTIDYLINYFDITIYYYNPNIYPEIEYMRRMQELKNYINLRNYDSVKFVEVNYNQNEYNKAILGLETLGEKSKRCYKCYLFRMEESAKYAAKNGFDYFTTTLSISPHKNSQWINEIGKNLEDKFGINYLCADFKKRNGYKMSLELSKKYNLYRQDYCGCKYSYLVKEKIKLEK